MGLKNDFVTRYAVRPSVGGRNSLPHANAPIICHNCLHKLPGERRKFRNMAKEGGREGGQHKENKGGGGFMQRRRRRGMGCGVGLGWGIARDATTDGQEGGRLCPKSVVCPLRRNGAKKTIFMPRGKKRRESKQTRGRKRKRLFWVLTEPFLIPRWQRCCERKGKKGNHPFFRRRLEGEQR